MANDEQETEKETAGSLIFWCSFFAAGIIGTLVVYGVQQEKIMQVPYSGELFTISAFLVFANRSCNFAFGLGMAFAKGETLLPQAPFWKYLIISGSNVSATTCQYEALKYVSFAVQMLGKSFKMMPVMIWGILVSKKRYTLFDWLVAAAVTGGVTMFLLTGPISSPDEGSSSVKGLMLLVLFLALDGLTSTMQEQVFSQHKSSKYNQILWVNLFSAIVSFITLLVSQTLGPSLAFCGAHSGFVKDLFLLSASAFASQWFIYSMVQSFGALAFAATMNVRQVVSIVVSYIQYDHSITILQVLSLLAVFGALGFKTYTNLTAGSRSKEVEKGK